VKLIVDCSDSGIYIVPFFNGLYMVNSVRKIEVGGNLLTNFLKKHISFHYFDVNRENLLCQTIKERNCFVSLNFLEFLIYLETWEIINHIDSRLI